MSANPVEVSPSLTEINTIGIGTTNYRIAHPHRGDYDNTRDYLRGDIIETGADDNSIFWIARAPIGAGNGEPSNADLGMWWRAAGHGFWRGELADDTRYQISQGDTFIANNEAWIAVGTVLGTNTGLELGTSNAVQGIERLVNDVTVYGPQSGSNALTGDLTDLRFLGAGVTVTESNEEVSIPIPGSTDDQNAGEVPVTATSFSGNLANTDINVQTALNTIDALTLGGGGLTEAQVDGRIATYARATPTGTMSEAQLPVDAQNAYISALLNGTSTGIVFNEVDGGADTLTLSLNASVLTAGTIADVRIPAGIARDSELPTIRTNADIDGRIATFARANSPRRHGTNGAAGHGNCKQYHIPARR